MKKELLLSATIMFLSLILTSCQGVEKQISKPVKNKRKIKTSVRGNDLVAMMYD